MIIDDLRRRIARVYFKDPMPKDRIYTDAASKPGGSSWERAKSQAQAKFRNALATVAYPESGSESENVQAKSKAI